MKLLHSIAITVLLSTSAYAQQDIELNGTTVYPVVKTSRNLFQSNGASKYIRLLNMELSQNAWSKLTKPANILSETNPIATETLNLPTQVQLGMNQLPVLDQGSYGTCVTFANTAAIDAVLNRGDYISQLCQLELGQYLENNTNGSFLSGWSGSMGPMVLTQMDHFGFVTKHIEQTIGCAGLSKYPTDGNIPQNEVDLPGYKKISTSLTNETFNVGWSSLMDFNQAFDNETDRNKLLTAVKESLHHGDRLTFGVLLFSPQMGMAGAVGKHAVSNDTWIITPAIDGMINIHDVHGGHEMIITGYDDNAIATDDNGQLYKGLLTLRNSWGKYAGDAGNFYMSYDYFTRLTVEVQRIRRLD